VKPETAAFLAKAREFLSKAEGMLDQGWADEAGRAAYLAGFHAAQALLFERTGTIVKTHAGVQSGFARLVKDEVNLDGELRRFLGRAYGLKALADYETGPAAVVKPDRARSATVLAARFVDQLTELISPAASACGRRSGD
jgi:uncharacterized protein (UPF0332 family)